jgi:hypothetical protein
MEEVEARAMCAELDPIIISLIKSTWNNYVETTMLPLAKARCPVAPLFRESFTVGTGMRKYPKRLRDTIEVRYDSNGVAYLASDDERMKWLEEGTRPHSINAKADMRGRSLAMTGSPGGSAFFDESASLKWRTTGGKLISGYYGVMHPGIDPVPVLAPVYYEAQQNFGQILGAAILEPTRTIVAKYGINI